MKTTGKAVSSDFPARIPGSYYGRRFKSSVSRHASHSNNMSLHSTGLTTRKLTLNQLLVNYSYDLCGAVVRTSHLAVIAYRVVKRFESSLVHLARHSVNPQGVAMVLVSVSVQTITIRRFAVDLNQSEWLPGFIRTKGLAERGRRRNRQRGRKSLSLIDHQLENEKKIPQARHIGVGLTEKRQLGQEWYGLDSPK